jgi:hypothetical protein
MFVALQVDHDVTFASRATAVPSASNLRGKSKSWKMMALRCAKLRFSPGSPVEIRR